MATDFGDFINMAAQRAGRAARSGGSNRNFSNAAGNAMKAGGDFAGAAATGAMIPGRYSDEYADWFNNELPNQIPVTGYAGWYEPHFLNYELASVNPGPGYYLDAGRKWYQTPGDSGRAPYFISTDRFGYLDESQKAQMMNAAYDMYRDNYYHPGRFTANLGGTQPKVIPTDPKFSEQVGTRGIWGLD